MSEPEKPLNRQRRAGLWSEPLANGVILLAWIAQFLLFSLDRFLHDPDAQSWAVLGARAVVTVIGILITVVILKLLQHGTGMPFAKRAAVALGLALAGATAHSVLNTWVFTIFMGSPGDGFSIESFGSLVYLFSWVYLAVTIILLSLTFGEELQNRERHIAELASDADGAQRLHATPEEPAHLWLRKGSERVRIDVSTIDWVEAEGEYVRFHCGAKSYLERQPIRAVEQKFARLGFARIHRSAVVNVDRVQALARGRSGAMQLLLRSGTELRVSKSYQPLVKRLLQGSLASD